MRAYLPKGEKRADQSTELRRKRGFEIPMEALYALKIRAIWLGFKEQSLGFWLVCFYLFIEYVRPQNIYTAIDVLPWAQTAILLMILVRLLDKEKFETHHVLTTLIFIFTLFVLLSALFAYDPSSEKTFDRLKTHVNWAIVFFLIVGTVNTEKRFFLFLFFYFLWNFKMSQHGFRSWTSHGFGYSRHGVVGGPAGWFHNAGEFGIEMCIFLPLSVSFIMALRSYWGRLKTALVALMPFTALASIVATDSRGAVLGAVASLTWMVLGSKLRVQSLVIAIAVVFLGYYLIPEETLERFSSAGTESDYTSQTRLQRWRVALEVMNDHPLVGIGPGNWMQYYSDQYPREEGREGWGLPHNAFLDAGAELGYTGLGLYILMIMFVFVTNARTRRLAKIANNRFLEYTALGFDAGMVGYLISGSFVSVLFYPYFWINAAFVAALNVVARGAAKSVERNNTNQPSKNTRQFANHRFT